MDRVKEAVNKIQIQHKKDISEARTEGFWIGTSITTFIIIAIWSLGKVLEKI